MFTLYLGPKQNRAKDSLEMMIGGYRLYRRPAAKTNLAGNKSLCANSRMMLSALSELRFRSYRYHIAGARPQPTVQRSMDWSRSSSTTSASLQVDSRCSPEALSYPALGCAA
jgi:hypothetical protein